MNVRGTFLLPVLLAGTAMSLIFDEQCVLDEPSGPNKVPLGSSLTLNCSVMCKSGSTTKMAWLFAGNKSENPKPVFNCSEVSSGGKLWCNHTLRPSTSGWYYCKVTIDIPILLQKQSIGTEVVVAGNDREDTTEAPQRGSIIDVLQSKLYLIISGIIVFTFIVLIVVLCVVKRRQRHEVMKCRIYGNTHRVPSPNRKCSRKPDTQVATRDRPLQTGPSAVMKCPIYHNTYQVPSANRKCSRKPDMQVATRDGPLQTGPSAVMKCPIYGNTYQVPSPNRKCSRKPNTQVGTRDGPLQTGPSAGKLARPGPPARETRRKSRPK